MKNQLVSDFAGTEQVFKSACVHRRLAANHLGIILRLFIQNLGVRGYACAGLRRHIHVIEHFGCWLKRRGVPPERLTTLHVHQFLRDHLSRCQCSKPAPKDREHNRAALRRFLEFLQNERLIEEPVITRSPQPPLESLMTLYERHMKQVCGLAEGTCRNRQRCARRFLKWSFGRGTFRIRDLQPKTVSKYVIKQAGQLQFASVHSMCINLRSFLHFLEFSQRGREGLAGAIPRLARTGDYALPKMLERKETEKFLNSFPRSTPRGRRDYAIALCLSELALRSEEVAGLSLEDVDWRTLTIRLAQTKQRRQRLLPLPGPIAKAILDYLKRGRPRTQNRALFVHHSAPVGRTLASHYVRKLVRRTFARCGISATGTHVLRHTWATLAHRRGASLKLIADLLGHRSLDATTRYAHVNLEELRQVALPWPRNKP